MQRFAVVILASLIGIAVGEEHPGESSERAHEADEAATGWWSRDQLTGSWGGAREDLVHRGLSIDLDEIGEVDRVFAGGARRDSAARSLSDLGLTYDLEKGLGWRGASIGADVVLALGDYGQPDVGAYQGFSNIDSDHRGVQWSTAWFEQWLADDIVGVKVGRITGSDFDRTSTAADFLNTSAVSSPTIYALPSYPTPAPMAELFVQPIDGLRLAFGAANSSDNDDIRVRSARRRRRRLRNDTGINRLFIGELAYEWGRERDGAGSGRAAVGVYHHTEHLFRFDGSQQDGANGAYATVEQQLVPRRGASADAEHGLFVFAQGGTADAHVADVVGHLAGGLSLFGTIASRADDSCGAYISAARFTDERGSGHRGGIETAYEMYYRVQITGWLSLQPDVQYITNPDDRRVRDPAWVGALRTEVRL